MKNIEEKPIGVAGVVSWELIDSLTGSVKASGVTHNLVTQVGDQYYAERAAGISSPPAQVTGAKLGTNSTTPAKTGGGAALGAYLTNSHQAVDGGFPTSALNGSARRITWRFTFAAGKATSSATPITEAVIVIDTLADATSSAANTICRALLAGVPSKQSTDIIVLTWTHDILGA